MSIKKERVPAIEYMRGISMLGVVGIHVGSQYLMNNPTPNLQLLALYEIVTRFSVPIFFFISAFGLFYNLDLQEKFNYKNFMKRRFKTVLIPYFLYFALYNNKSNVVFTSSIEFDWHFIFWFSMLSVVFHDIIGLVLCFNATVDFYCKKIKYCIISSFICFSNGSRLLFKLFDEPIWYSK